MRKQSVWFNFILWPLLAGVAAGGFGCQSPEEKAEKVQDPVLLQFHLEVNPDGTDKSKPVTVNRSTPFQVNAQQQAFLTENFIVSAALVDDSMGGFSLKVQFNRRGTWLLEQYTTANKGKRVAILGGFGQESRWLAAPVLEKRIADGAFAFTPDASRDETDLIVRGLNQQGEEVKHDDR